MSRLFWVGLGAAAGVMIVRRLTAAAHALTPVGISTSLGASVRELGDAAYYLTAQVRRGMSERERDLYETLGVTPDGTAARTPADTTAGPRPQALEAARHADR